MCACVRACAVEGWKFDGVAMYVHFPLGDNVDDMYSVYGPRDGGSYTWETVKAHRYVRDVCT